MNRLADLHRQGFMRSAFADKRKPKAPPKPAEGCPLCMDWHTPGKHFYTVWAVSGDMPLSDGSRAFEDQKSAERAAESRAISTRVDQAVSRGRDPQHRLFKIVARYEAGSGQKGLKPNARPEILIVSTNLVSDAELDKHNLATRRYMRIGPSGTGQRIRPSPIDMIKVETHPEWARATGEKYARLHWCETCEQYTEWAGGECQNH